ncbi:protein FAR1-RELATED SEQUENCE 5-like [Carya illinoinensis]|uniref:protein FAR1-RELATED SEQUENCE 5-like n=1 Tax=Carya illinoinensis TaxID=32201 RepID=UPI001C722A4D|nr:protein FAR1-RELATED SEQUENCE 5-like [Carya illinoinensis]XP_042983438.1 protein FAR1-RELATED SEQUENCE 5-like [Carya illinoinensis]
MNSEMDLSNNEYHEVGVDNEQDNNETVEEPKVGMTFSSVEEVWSYYMKYGKQKGFGVCKRNSKQGDDGNVRWFTLVCARQGTSKSKAANVLKPRQTEKIGCMARINATLNDEGGYTLSKVNLDHTHVCSPEKARHFRCFKKVNARVSKRFKINDEAGIRMKKNFKSLVVEAKGYENVPFEEERRNNIDNERQLRLGVGGAEALCNYFRQMQKKDPDFYYEMDVDNDLMLKNVFWADARSRAAYQSFRDVITFDTTYLTNAYKMPFVSFVGVNHHGQSILFGCGLISNEDMYTFEWLFKSWLNCMNDQPPNAIITDQDKALQLAISKVFPTSRHRFCLWHIMKKLPKKFGSHSRYEEIKSTLQKCVYDSLSEQEFEERWHDLLNTYDLHENAWLGSLYGDRRIWVPAYIRDTFWAGMSTAQRSEGMNAFFDNYVNSRTTLKQFVDQYDSALRRKVENEAIADFNSFNTNIPCISHYPLEKHFQKAYTISKFKEVQDELRGFLYLTTSLLGCEGRKYTYIVADEVQVSDELIKRANYIVKLDEDLLEVNCSCKLFEFRGILCKHALRILTQLGKSTIPSKYILDRWRKDIKRKYTFIKLIYEATSNPERQRYDRIQNCFYELCSNAAKTESNCVKLINQLEQLKLEFR